MTRDKLSVRKAAQHFNVSTLTIQMWQKSTERKPIPGRPAKITQAQILADIEKYPDDYQYEDARQREQFKNLIEDLEPALPLIYIDESGFQSDDTRSHSYRWINSIQSDVYR